MVPCHRDESDASDFDAFDPGFGSDSENQSIVVLLDRLPEGAIDLVLHVQLVWSSARKPGRLVLRGRKGGAAGRVVLGEAQASFRPPSDEGSHRARLEFTGIRVGRGGGIGLEELDIALDVVRGVHAVQVGRLRVRLYLLNTEPLEPWCVCEERCQGMHRPWTRVLDVVCAWARGSRQPEVRDRLVQRILEIGGARVRYDGASSRYVSIGSRFELQLWLRRLEGTGSLPPSMNCADLALLTAVLCRILSVPMDVARVRRADETVEFDVPRTWPLGWAHPRPSGGPRAHEVAGWGRTADGQLAHVVDPSYRLAESAGQVHAVIGFTREDYCRRVLRVDPAKVGLVPDRAVGLAAELGRASFLATSGRIAKQLSDLQGVGSDALVRQFARWAGATRPAGPIRCELRWNQHMVFVVATFSRQAGIDRWVFGFRGATYLARPTKSHETPLDLIGRGVGAPVVEQEGLAPEYRSATQAGVLWRDADGTVAAEGWVEGPDRGAREDWRADSVEWSELRAAFAPPGIDPPG